VVKRPSTIGAVVLDVPEKTVCDFGEKTLRGIENLGAIGFIEAAGAQKGSAT
jgi:hypothetical protein